MTVTISAPFVGSFEPGDGQWPMIGATSFASAALLDSGNGR